MTRVGTGRATGALLAITLAIAASTARAGRPLQTEDAGVLARGECEVESTYGRESGPDAPITREATAQVGCGVGAQTQLALALTRTRSDGHSNSAALVGKTFLRELTDTQAGFTVAYALGGERISGQAFRHETTEVRAVATVPFAGGAWLLHGNLGASRSESARQDSTIWSAAVERLGVGRVDLMAEIFGDDRSAPWWNAGLRYTAIAQRLFLDASWGAQLRGGRPRLLTVGLKFAF